MNVRMDNATVVIEASVPNVYTLSACDPHALFYVPDILY